MDANFETDLSGFRCPRLDCDGRMERSNSHWECSECAIEMKNRAGWWDLMDKFQKESCVKVLSEATAGRC